jgi:hypothetical protein
MNYVGLIIYILFLLLPQGTAFAKSHFDHVPKESKGMKTGPETGSIIPQFSLPDQNGKMVDFDTVAGPKGALILFHRSADW